jgi:hypothetical protein
MAVRARAQGGLRQVHMDLIGGRRAGPTKQNSCKATCPRLRYPATGGIGNPPDAATRALPRA